MSSCFRKLRGVLHSGGANAAIVYALMAASGAGAQTPAPAQSADQARAADLVDPSSPSAGEKLRGDDSDIVVTGSRIQRAGLDAPTPTTVIGAIELRQGNRPSIAQVLDDLPEFRATSTPATTTGNTNNSASTADLRGLGAVRTLTLINGHRFTGSNDLNVIPQNLIKRVDVVTGGASAAWGSGAVSGVVNIILDDALTGVTLGADAGLASRGDGARYSVNGTFGTSFAGGRGHFMVAGDYTKENGIFGRTGRPNLQSAIFQRADNQLILANNVNYTIINTGGVIIGGKAAGQVFNYDGSLSPQILGSQTNGSFTVGGNGHSIYDFVAVSSPYDRGNVFARASYDLADTLKVWLDGSFSRVTSNFPFFPETPIVSIRADNAFLTPTAKTQLAALGATYPFTLGRILTDVGSTGYLGYHSVRRNLEGAAGFDGSFGGSWKYGGYYDHGELRNDQSIYNSRITANFNKAVDAVTGPGGQAVCRVNAVTVTDPACSPIDLFGNGNVSAAAVAYAFGANRQITTTKLDAAGVNLRGQPFKTWAGPVDVAVGGDFRWESFATNYIDPVSLANGFASLNFTATNGSFNVKEGFGEVNVPLLDLDGKLHLEVNGAARYSDYSTSGGIWSWKYGGTARVFRDILLRGTFSRDIRSPSIAEYFTNRALNLSNVNDPYKNNISVANVRNFTGGNPGLTPETSHTLTIGGSYAPHYISGLNFSVDYYKIDIRNVIATLALQDLLNSCYSRAPGDPTCGGLIVRTADGSIDSVSRTYINFAEYKTRGLDFEASYLLPLDRVSSGMPGSLRFRALATRVIDLLINDGVHTIDRAGIVGDTTTFSTPKWRATGSMTYQDEALGVDLRVRYVGGGLFVQPYDVNGVVVGQLVLNNQVTSRTYVDLGIQYKAGPFTIFGNVNNLFDRDPPYVTYASATYDMIGRYITAGVKLRF